MKAKPPRTIVLGYVRVSTDMQVRRGRSLVDQRRRLKAYAEWKLGLELPDDLIYSDPGVSGTWTVRQVPLPKARVRPALSELVDRCARGDVEALIIDTIDRLGRDRYVCIGIQRHLEPYGTRVLVADGDHDFSDPEDELVLTMQMGVARAEVRKMSHRATRAQGERRAAGYPPWGKVGYGWRWQTREEFLGSGQPFRGIARVEEEAEVVAWLYEQYLHRGRVLLDICAELNDRAVPYRGSAVRWQAHRLRAVLDNPHHAGLVKDNDLRLSPGRPYLSGTGLLVLTTGSTTVFRFDCQGRVAKSTHAGIPWLWHIRRTTGDAVHLCRFSAAQIPGSRMIWCNLSTVDC